MPEAGFVERGAIAVKRTAGRAGQSLVEFAISLTAFLILLVGMVDFGIGLLHYLALRHAAQEGALYGSINPPPAAGSWSCPHVNIDPICDRIASASGESGLLEKMYRGGMTATVSASDGACEGRPLSVTLQYDYPLTMPFLGTILGSNHIRLTARAVNTILLPSCP